MIVFIILTDISFKDIQFVLNFYHECTSFIFPLIKTSKIFNAKKNIIKKIFFLYGRKGPSHLKLNTKLHMFRTPKNYLFVHWVYLILSYLFVIFFF